MGKPGRKSATDQREKHNKSSVRAAATLKARREERELQDRISKQSSADRISELERLIHRAEDKVEKLHSDIQAVDLAHGELEKELVKQRDALAAAEAASAPPMPPSDAAKLAAMTLKLETARKDLEGTTKRIAELQDERTRLEREIAIARGETRFRCEGRDEAASALKSAQHELERLCELRRSDRLEAGREESRVERKTDAELRELERRIEDAHMLEDKIEQLASAIREIRQPSAIHQELVRTAAAVVSAKAEVLHLQSQNQALVFQRRAKEVELATAQVARVAATPSSSLNTCKPLWTLRDERFLRDARKELRDNQAHAELLEAKIAEFEAAGEARARAQTRTTPSSKGLAYARSAERLPVATLVAIVKKLNRATTELRSENANLLLDLVDAK